MVELQAWKEQHALADAGQQRQQEGAEEAAGEHSVGEALGAGGQESAGDDTERVDQRREGRDGVAVAGLQGGGEQAAEHVEDLRGQEDAGQRGELLELGGLEAGRDEVHERGRELPQEQRRKPEDQGQEGRDGREGALGGLWGSVGEVALEDRDEDDRERATGEQVVEEVGQDEGGPVDIGVGARAERAADHGFAHQADDAAEENAAAPDQGRDGDGAVGQGGWRLSLRPEEVAGNRRRWGIG
jgi:hypothetical protein